mmetsp:Transcript_66654/g.124433  ORF Transcript_66654/g.124433 Transcript_66654/m.124433 type:complete len:262 (+) Transcript_66654:71-856(+)
MLTLVKILLCIGCWESLYQVAHAVLPSLATKLLSSSAARDQRDKFTRCGASYVVAFCHACLMGSRGSWHLWALLPAPEPHKLAIPDEAVQPWYQLTSATETTNLLFFSWLAQDFIHIALQFPRLGGYDTLFHHVGFMTASAICGNYRILPFAFAWLLCGELSSIPLNIRWFLINTGYGDCRFLQVTNVIFAATFFATRIVGYGLGIWHFFSVRHALFQMDVPSPFLLVVLVLLVAGYILNLMWMQKIVQMAAGKKKKMGKH